MQRVGAAQNSGLSQPTDSVLKAATEEVPATYELRDFGQVVQLLAWEAEKMG